VPDSARTPGHVAWPEKLITQAEAFVLAGNWPVYAAVVSTPGPMNVADFDVNLYCRKCRQSCGQLRRGGASYNSSLDEMLSAVLRHMVMAHDVPLAGLRKDAGGT
jgi:hypothetical protein